MKVLITGASGLLGRAIKTELDQNTSWEVIGLGFTRLDGGLKKVNLQNEIEINEFINEFQPDVVVHAAAERRPDVVKYKEEETENLNVTATENIAKAVNKYGGFMVYISTDYVFDGTKPPYKASDTPNPLNKYGMTKLRGEKCTLEFCKKAGVLRLPILYGPLKYISESAVTGLFPLLHDTNTQSTISNYELRYPTSTSDIAVVCRQIIEHQQRHPSFGGIWQWRSNDKLTKYQMIKVMSEAFQLSMEHIKPSNEPTAGALRPFDTEFDCSELESIGIACRTSFKDGMKTVIKPFL